MRESRANDGSADGRLASWRSSVRRCGRGPRTRASMRRLARLVLSVDPRGWGIDASVPAGRRAAGRIAALQRRVQESPGAARSVASAVEELLEIHLARTDESAETVV